MKQTSRQCEQREQEEAAEGTKTSHNNHGQTPSGMQQKPKPKQTFKKASIQTQKHAHTSTGDFATHLRHEVRLLPKHRKPLLRDRGRAQPRRPRWQNQPEKHVMGRGGTRKSRCLRTLRLPLTTVSVCLFVFAFDCVIVVASAFVSSLVSVVVSASLRSGASPDFYGEKSHTPLCLPICLCLSVSLRSPSIFVCLRSVSLPRSICICPRLRNHFPPCRCRCVCLFICVSSLSHCRTSLPLSRLVELVKVVNEHSEHAHSLNLRGSSASASPSSHNPSILQRNSPPETLCCISQELLNLLRED